ncbi:hypothetical protein MRX96_007080 [Rhipicephalus microplus]
MTTVRADIPSYINGQMDADKAARTAAPRAANDTAALPGAKKKKKKRSRKEPGMGESGIVSKFMDAQPSPKAVTEFKDSACVCPLAEGR